MDARHHCGQDGIYQSKQVMGDYQCPSPLVILDDGGNSSISREIRVKDNLVTKCRDDGAIREPVVHPKPSVNAIPDAIFD